MIDLKKVLAGAVSGFVAAAIADLDAWRDGRDPDGGLPGFDWAKAFRRYVAGLVSGAMAALGMGQL